MFTTREIEIARELLDSLRVGAPTLFSEVVLHANVCLRLENQGLARPTRDEFEAVLKLLDAAGLLTSDRNPVTGNVRWTISAQGRVALKDLR